ncbi:MAG: ThuA domain-containing protein [Cytophagales bacterium]|nr:MAG: ThuA domain-containing protein [Cytophagales bacterium]
MKTKSFFYLLPLVFLFTCKNGSVSVLVFSKTAAFRHESIKYGKEAFLKLGKTYNINVDTTEDASKFTDLNLKRYKAIVFLSTTGDVLNNDQQAAFERFIKKGNGFVGVHAASDCEYEWPWFVSLVGGNFNGHPAVQTADLHLTNTEHVSTKMLPLIWQRTDEWYNFRNLNPKTNVLIKIDEKSYQGGEHGVENTHPMCWYHAFDGGRAWYTALGHTNESYSEDLFLKHLVGGVKYAIGE